MTCFMCKGKQEQVSQVTRKVHRKRLTIILLNMSIIPLFRRALQGVFFYPFLGGSLLWQRENIRNSRMVSAASKS